MYPLKRGPERVAPRLRSPDSPLPDLRNANAPTRQPAHRDPVQPRSSIQAGAESVAAALVYAGARNVEVLTDFQPVNAGRDLAVLARLVDAWTEIRVPQRDAVFVAARGIDNLPGRDGTVRVDPVATTTAGRGRVVDVLAFTVLPCWREFSHWQSRMRLQHDKKWLYRFPQFSEHFIHERGEFLKIPRRIVKR